METINQTTKKFTASKIIPTGQYPDQKQVLAKIHKNARLNTKLVLRDKTTSERTFSVSEISSCQRQAFYRRSFASTDVLAGWTKFKNEHRQRNALELHYVLSQCLGWNELPVSTTFEFDNPQVTLILNGRIDVYDWEANVVYDIKTTKAVKWQVERKYIPRIQELIQLQCYGSILSGFSKFILLYVEEELLTHIENIIANQRNLQLAERMIHLIEVPNVDRTSWIKERMLNLYTSTYLTGKGPNPEPSNSCNFCPYKNKCTDETGVIIPNIT